MTKINKIKNWESVTKKYLLNTCKLIVFLYYYGICKKTLILESEYVKILPVIILEN